MFVVSSGSFEFNWNSTITPAAAAAPPPPLNAIAERRRYSACWLPHVCVGNEKHWICFNDLQG